MAGSTTEPWEGVQNRHSLRAIGTPKPDSLSTKVTRRPFEVCVRLREEFGMHGPVHDVDAIVHRREPELATIAPSDDVSLRE
jgi:hypothetical protein